MTYAGKVTIGSNSYPVASTLYGTCATAAATAAKVVTCADFDTLLTGVTIFVKFTYANTVANPTMNVNSTGAKEIYRYGTTAPSTSAATSWNAGSVVGFTYDGTYWQMHGWLNDNTNTAVTQTISSTTNADYRVLFSATADDTTRTEGARKDTDFKYNPSTNNLTVGALNGVTVGTSALTTTTKNITGAINELNSNLAQVVWVVNASMGSSTTGTLTIKEATGVSLPAGKYLCISGGTIYGTYGHNYHAITIRNGSSTGTVLVDKLIARGNTNSGNHYVMGACTFELASAVSSAYLRFYLTTYNNTNTSYAQRFNTLIMMRIASNSVISDTITTS